MIVKIWPIKADYGGDRRKVGGVEGLKNAEEYIKDEQKVISTEDGLFAFKVFDEADMLDGSFINTEPNFHRVVNYMADERKTKATYISTYLCESENIVDDFLVAQELLAVKSGGKVKRNHGAIAYHLVQSFPEGLDISDEEVHECGRELIKKLGAHQALICSHVHPVIQEDGEVHGKCKHNHMLINAYICPEFYDPQKGGPAKYNDCKETYQQLQVWNDTIAIAHGLPIIRDLDMNRTYSWTESEEKNKGASWKERVRMDIEMYRRAARNWSDFVKIAEMNGYQIRQKRHTVYQTPDGHTVRGSTLGRQYTKEYLEPYWAIRDHAMELIREDLHENKEPILSDFIYHYPGKLSVKLPLGPQYKSDRKFTFLSLDKDQKANEEALKSYMAMDQLYDICDESGQPVSAASGLEILRSIEDLRDEDMMKRREQIRMEEEEIREARRRREAELAANRYEKMHYSNEKFKSSRTGIPYRTSIYDENGRRRNMIELIYILALIILDREAILWMPKDVPEERENEVFFAPTNLKIQYIVDAIELARLEELETRAQLTNRLKVVGAEYSRARKALDSVTRAKDRMEPLAEAVARFKKTRALAESIQAMPDGPEKEALQREYAHIIEEYKAAKHILYVNQISAEAGVIDFDLRYERITNDVRILKERKEENAEHYKRLKKLSYSLQLAEDPYFIYGPAYPVHKYIPKEENREPEQNLWHKLEQPRDPKTQPAKDAPQPETKRMTKG